MSKIFLFHTLVWVPDTLLLPDIQNLADVVRVMGSDVSDERCIRRELFVIGIVDGFLPVGENLIQLFDQIGLLVGRELVEGLVIVAVKFWILLASKVVQCALIPIPDVVGQLAD